MFCRQWENFMCRNEGLAQLRATHNPDIASIFLFLIFVTRGYFSNSAKHDWKMKLILFLGAVLSIGFESWVYFHHIPNLKFPCTIRKLYGEKKTLRNDVGTVRAWIKQARNVGGSSNLVFTAVSSCKWLDMRCTSAVTNLSVQRSRALFDGARSVCMNWDPGTYSNKPASSQRYGHGAVNDLVHV